VWLSLLYWVFAVVFGRLTTLFLIWLRAELLAVFLGLNPIVTLENSY
jgi:hypothetical protein